MTSNSLITVDLDIIYVGGEGAYWTSMNFNVGKIKCNLNYSYTMKGECWTENETESMILNWFAHS